MGRIAVSFLLLLLPSCSRMQSPPMRSWMAYVDACTARVTSSTLPFCPSFPFPPNDKGRGEAIGAAIGAAQDVGEALAPLVLPALAGKAVVE